MCENPIEIQHSVTVPRFVTEPEAYRLPGELLPSEQTELRQRRDNLARAHDLLTADPDSYNGSTGKGLRARIREIDRWLGV